MQGGNQASCLNVERVGEVSVARFTCEVVLSGKIVESVGEQLSALVGGPGGHWLILDFANVTSLSSLMLAKLVSLNRTAEAAGGRLALCNLRPVIHEIMEVTHLLHVLQVYPTEQDARMNF